MQIQAELRQPESQSLNDIRESLIRDTLSELEPLYIPFTYQWIKENRPDLDVQLIKLEERIENCNLSLFDDEDFKNFLTTYVRWHKTATALYRNHLHKKGGDLDMGIPIAYEEPVLPGAYDALIKSVEAKDGKFGQRLHVGFDLDEGKASTGFFPIKATRNNKTGRLIERALGEYREVKDTDELIGKKVRVLIEETHSNGSVYTNVTKVL